METIFTQYFNDSFKTKHLKKKKILLYFVSSYWVQLTP